MANQFAPTPSSDNLLVGKGEVFFNRFDANGVGTGLRHLGNVDAMEITTEDDVLEKYSNMSSDAPLYKKVPRRRNVGVRLTLSEFDPQNLSIVTMGTVDTTATQAGTAVTGEVLTTNAVHGAFYKFAKIGPHTGVTVTGSGGAAVLGTDYRIHNPDLGIIQVLPGSTAIPAGSTITVGYTPTAYTAGEIAVVAGGESSTVEGSLLFIGDPATGPRMQVEIWKVSFNPDGALALISDEFADVGIQGNVLADPVNHPTNKLYRVTYLPY